MTQERPVDQAPPEPAATPAAEDAPSHRPAALRTLKQAMRRARFDDAERVGVISDLRAARIGRLELLEEALQPLSAQIPEDADAFDFGLMPGANPRLFLDMIGFVEMGRDARTYRLLQDTRYGRKLLAESDSLERMVDAATDYVARRLLERDKALAADPDPFDEPSPARPRASQAATNPPAAPGAPAPRPGRIWRMIGAAFAVLIDLLGAIAFFSILFWIGWLVWTRAYGHG